MCISSVEAENDPRHVGARIREGIIVFNREDVD
jgi:hypothetical protein